MKDGRTTWFVHLVPHVDLHICMELELIGHVSNSKVALSDFVPASLKGRLITSEPAFEAHHAGTVDGCAVDVVVNVTAEVDVLTFVACLDLATFLAGSM